MIKVGIDDKGIRKGAAAIEDKLGRSLTATADKATGLLKAASGITSLGPIAGGVAGGVMSLGATFAAAGAAAGVFGAVAKSAMGEVTEASTQVETLEDKIEKYAAQADAAARAGLDNADALKAQGKATLELQAYLASLPADVRKMAEASGELKDKWGGFVDQNKPAVYSLMSDAYDVMGTAIGKLQPLFDAGAKGARGLLAAAKRVADGDALIRWGAAAEKAIDPLVGIAVNVGTALGGMFGKIGTGAGEGILKWLEDITARWAQWATATEQDSGISKFADYLTTNGPLVAGLLGDIAQAAVAVAAGIGPLAPVTAAVAGALAVLIAAVPPSWITAIVAGFIAYGVALKAYAAYQAIATAAQWANNAAMLASPTTWIILAIVALVAVIVLVATKTKFFQTVWQSVWGFMKAVGAWFAGPFVNFFKRVANAIVSYYTFMWNRLRAIVNFIVGYYRFMWNTWSSVANKVISKGKSLVGWFASAPGRIKNALSGMWSGLWTGFRSAANKVISGWNNLSFGIPGFSFAGMSVPGFSVGTPDIPYLADGGITTGPTLAMIGEGSEDEAVIPLSRLPELAGRSDDRPIVVEIAPGGERDFRRWINKTVRVKGALRTTGA